MRDFGARTTRRQATRASCLGRRRIGHSECVHTRVNDLSQLAASHLSGRAAIETIDNDPSAGSPTETLLRLLLPLNDPV